jgi:hypothetical protein
MTSASLNDFSLCILANNMSVRRKYMNRAHYYILRDGSEYQIRLSNDRSVKCDATVWIDGEQIGVWRINPHSDITIERPTNINRKFTFLKKGTNDAHSAGIKCGKMENGIIKVTFEPEKQHVYTEAMYYHNDDDNIILTNYSQKSQQPQPSQPSQPSQRMVGMNMANTASISNINTNTNSNLNYSHGATALGDKSRQKFCSASPIYDIDTANVTTIIVRLLVDDTFQSQPPSGVSLRSAMLCIALMVSFDAMFTLPNEVRRGPTAPLCITNG